MRLEASIDVSRLLLQDALSFRGHDDSESSTNQGFFLGLIMAWGQTSGCGKSDIRKCPHKMIF